MNKMIIRVQTPDKTIYEEEILSMEALAGDGLFTILPDHAPLVATVATGELMVEEREDRTVYIAIDSGLIEVSNNVITVLTQDGVVAYEKGDGLLKMEAMQKQRRYENVQAREQLVRSELELYRLLTQGGRTN